MREPATAPTTVRAVGSDGARRRLTGAEALVGAAVAAGIEVCFANPGTTEMPIVSALDTVPGLRAVLGLHENVCTGAADGYARIAGSAALTVLHLGPGLANGLANLHNARRAGSPVVNLVGDHASWHLAYDAPLTSDIAALARTVGTVLTARGRETLADDLVAVVTRATQRLGVASLVVPADLQQAVRTEEPSGPAPVVRRTSQVPGDRVREVAGLLAEQGKAAVLLLGGTVLSRAAQLAAGRIAAATGATLYGETFPARAERGGGLPGVDRLPYFPEAAAAALEGRHVVLAGAAAPVAYFGYEGQPSRLAPEHLVHRLSGPAEDGEQALLALADRLGAADRAEPVSAPGLPPRSTPLDGRTVGATLAALLPDGAIVSIEGGTCGYPFFSASAAAPPHTCLTNTGGAIGQGLPVALGAAIAAPDRPVVALQSDGSGLYTPQALWTMAREQCDVVVLIAANHAYGVLRTELGRHDNPDPGPQARELTSLASPRLSWVDLAHGFGVPAARAATVGELADRFETAVITPGPHLIEMAL
jgi:acetolactate synthase-1/2/3 large subunit